MGSYLSTNIFYWEIVVCILLVYRNKSVFRGLLYKQINQWKRSHMTTAPFYHPIISLSVDVYKRQALQFTSGKPSYYILWYFWWTSELPCNQYQNRWIIPVSYTHLADNQIFIVFFPVKKIGNRRVYWLRSANK